MQVKKTRDFLFVFGYLAAQLIQKRNYSGWKAHQQQLILP